MSADRERMCLDDACVFLNGLWKGKKPPFVEAGVIRNTNFSAQDGLLDFSDIAYLEVEEKQIDKRRLQLGDIILEKSGGGPKQAVGRVALFDRVEENFSFSNFTSAIRIRCPQKLDYRYLHKYLYWIYVSGVTESMQSHSTGIRNLSVNAYKSLEIATPALSEQRRIVAILDEAFAGIATARANAERNLKNAHELFENHHHTLFELRGSDCRECPLGELGEFRNGVNYTKQSDGLCVRVVGVKDFKNRFEIPLSGLDTVQLDGSLASIDALRENDILFVRSNGNPKLIGRCLLAGPVEEKIVHSGFTIRLRLSCADVSPRYLCHFLKTPAVRRGLTDAGTGANIRSLNQQMLSAISVPIPPKSEQAVIVARLESLANEISQLDGIYQRKLAALEELKKSLLIMAFAGEL